MEIRQEDLGKMMLKNADILDINITKEKLSEFFRDSKNSLYLLYSCSWFITAVAEIIYFIIAYKKVTKNLED